MTKRLTTEQDGSPSASRAVAIWSCIVTVIVLPVVVCLVAVIGVLKDQANTGEVIAALAVFATPLVGLSVGALFSKRPPPAGGG